MGPRGGAGWQLGEEGLLDRAAALTAGLTDLGGEQVWKRFRMMVRLAEMGGIPGIPMSAEGKDVAERKLLEVLVQRLEFVADEARYPAIRTQPIERPIIVMGIARSGTTLLHSLLASDPEHRAPRYWEIRQPSPPPSLPRVDDAAIEAATRELRTIYEDHPEALAAHPYFDQGGLTLAECEWIWESPAYLWGYMSEDHVEQYAFHRVFLQHLQYSGGAQRWALKGALHQYRLAELLDAYPDAVLVWIHRDPLRVLASALAYKWVASGAPKKDRRAWALSKVSGIEQLVSGALASPHLDRVHDVLYRDLVADPVGRVQEIYERAGLPFTTVAEAAVRGWIDDPANRSDRHGRFTYSLDDFGLEPQAMERRFAPYRDRFGIPRER